MTLEELGEKSGYTGPHICKIELNKTEPTPQALRRIAGALGVNPSRFRLLPEDIPSDVLRAYGETPEAMLAFSRMSSAQRERLIASRK